MKSTSAHLLFKSHSHAQKCYKINGDLDCDYNIIKYTTELLSDTLNVL